MSYLIVALELSAFKGASLEQQRYVANLYFSLSTSSSSNTVKSPFNTPFNTPCKDICRILRTTLGQLGVTNVLGKRKDLYCLLRLP